MANITPGSLDYSAKDFSSLRRRLFQLIASVFPAWTDTDVANFGNILTELFARVGDVLGFYQDRQSNEARITTAMLRKSMLALAKLTAFAAPGSMAAEAVETFTLVNPQNVPTPTGGDVLIAAGTKVTSAAVPAQVVFQLLADVTIPAGQTSAQGTVENSASFTDSFISTGLGGQTFRLSQTPYLDGSLVMSAANGAYVEVPDLLSSKGTDLDYTVTVDENDSAVVSWGDGNLGAIPEGTVFLEYRTWNGLLGTVAPGALNRITGSLVDSLGTSVRVVVTNAASSTPGVDRPGVEQLRQEIPQQTRLQGRAVAREDFEIGAANVPGVARALHLTKNEDPAIGENAGFTFLVPVGGGAPSQLLIDAVRAQFFQVPGYPKPPLPALQTYQLSIVGALYLQVNVFAKIYKRKGTTGPVAKAAILASLGAYFAIQNVDGSANAQISFGYYLQAADGTPTQSLAYGDLFTLVDKTAGVLKLGAGLGDFLLNGQHADVPIVGKQFPQLGAVEILDGDTGLVL